MIIKKLRIAALLSVLTVFSLNAFATYTVIGCVSDDTGYLYTGSAGVNSPRSWMGPAYETTPVVTSGQLGTGIYCVAADLGPCVIRSKSNCRECTGMYDYDSRKNREDWWYEQAGRLKGYMQCPIDDYVGLLLTAIGGLGFLALRKTNLL